MTHDERVLELLSDGQPHSHSEVYDLHVVAHSRVASLRRKGYLIDCWKDANVYWYMLVGERRASAYPQAPAAPAVDVAPLADEHGQLQLVSA